MKGIKKPLAKVGEKPKDNDKFIFEGKVKILLFSGVLWYKLSNGLKWPDIGRLMEENGLNYKHKQFRTIESNWGAGSLIYFFHLYNVLKLPTPTSFTFVSLFQSDMMSSLLHHALLPSRK